MLHGTPLGDAASLRSFVGSALFVHKQRTTLSFVLLAVAGGSILAQTPARGSLQLFLLAGQSNMAGRGTVEDADPVPIPGVFTQKKLAWAQAVDPIHFDRSERIGVGMGRSFALTQLDSNEGGDRRRSSMLRLCSLCCSGSRVTSK